MVATFVSPVNGAIEQPEAVPIVAHINTGSTAYTKVETSQADFAAGTLTSVVAAASGALELALSQLSFSDTYESDTIGSVPTGYTIQQGSGFSVQNSTNGTKAVKCATSADTMKLLVRDTPSQQDWDVYVDMMSEGSGNPFVVLRLTGSGSSWTALGYYLNSHDGYLRVTKLIQGVNETTISQVSASFSPNTWYHVRCQAIGTTIRMKYWTGSTEPDTWNIDTTSSLWTTSGVVGFARYWNYSCWWDNLRTAVQGGSSYVGSGNRVSPAYSLASVGVAGAVARIEWDETVPANTSITIKAKINSGSFVACTNGGAIPGIAYGDNLSAATITLEEDLATTDSAVTPTLSEVRLIFAPIDPSLVSMEVAGTTLTVANGGLEQYNDVSGTTPAQNLSDAYFATQVPWEYAAGAHEVVTAEMFYDGTSIGSISFTLDGASCQGTTATKVAWLSQYSVAAAVNVLWAAVEYPGVLYTFKVGWIAAEPPRGMVDAQWMAAYAIRSRTVGAGVVGEVSRSRLPAAGVVEGLMRTHTPAAGIVQGWIRSRIPAAGSVGLPSRSRIAAAGIVGVTARTRLPAAGIVYEVNRDTVVELSAIDPTTQAVLDGLGVTYA